MDREKMWRDKVTSVISDLANLKRRMRGLYSIPMDGNMVADINMAYRELDELTLVLKRLREKHKKIVEHY